MAYLVSSRAMTWFSLALVGAMSNNSEQCAEPFATSRKFSLTYTFTTSTPATPIDVGGGRDLAVNRNLTTTVNDANKGFLNFAAGRCTN